MGCFLHYQHHTTSIYPREGGPCNLAVNYLLTFGSPYPLLHKVLPQDFMTICCPQDPKVCTRLPASPEALRAQLPQDSPGPRSNAGDTKLHETGFPNAAREAEQDRPHRAPGHQTGSLPASEPGHFSFSWTARHRSAARNRGGSPAAPHLPSKQNKASKEQNPLAALACSLPLCIAAVLPLYSFRNIRYTHLFALLCHPSPFQEHTREASREQSRLFI